MFGPAAALVALLLAATAVVGAADAGPWGRRALRADGVQAAIVGGRHAVRGRYPWNAGLRLDYAQFNYPLFCGAILVHPQVAVTAAHCVVNEKGGWHDQHMAFPQVRLGGHEKEGGRYEARQGVWTLVHEKYNADTFDEDIALILLDKPSTKKPVRMCPSLPDPPVPDNTTVHAVGWGFVADDGPTSRVLKEVAMRMLPLKTCHKYFPERDWENNSMLCAGDTRFNVDTCEIDDGGPLFVKGKTAADDVLIGLTSWGIKCAGDFPGVYTDLAYMRKWVDRGIKVLMSKNKPGTAARLLGKGYRLRGKKP